jgi:preprotein translocase subunit SecB
MEVVKSTLKFDTFVVEKMNFSITKPIPDNSDVSIEIEPQFSRKIIKITENEYDMLLGVLINDESKPGAIPFNAEVVVKGRFLLNGIDNHEKHLKINAVAILFPYLRATLSTLMALANVEPFFIPPINLVEMFKKSEENNMDDKQKVQ